MIGQLRDLTLNLDYPWEKCEKLKNSHHYILLINRDRGHYREISDFGLNVLIERSLGQYIKASVREFPVMIERMRLISYLLYGLFSAVLKTNTIKTPEVIFHIRLDAPGLSSSPILTKYLYASFSFSY